MAVRLRMELEFLKLNKIIPPDLKLDLPDEIRNDVGQFLEHVSEELPNLKAMGIDMDVKEAMQMLRDVYLG